ELQTAGDPSLHLPLTADYPVLVVQASTVAVHKAALGCCDQLAQRRHPVLKRHQIVRTILPSCSPVSSRSCAARISSSGSTESTTGSARPLVTSSRAPAKSSPVPIVEPRIVSCFHQIRCSAAGGFGPLAAPHTVIRPPGAAT